MFGDSGVGYGGGGHGDHGNGEPHQSHGGGGYPHDSGGNGQQGGPPEVHPQFGDPSAIKPQPPAWHPTPPIPVNSWDNHEAHIQYHNMFRKTQEFELLPDEVKQAFELHVQMHQMALISPLQGAFGTMPPANPDMAAQAQQMSDQNAQAQIGQQQYAQQQQQQQSDQMNNQVSTNLQQALTMSQIDANHSTVARNTAQAENYGNQN